MTPLARVGWGLLVVALDLRIEGLDLLVDPLGWALALSGWFALQGRNSWFGGAVAGGLVGCAVSIFAVTQPLDGLPSMVDTIAQTAVVFCTCSAIARLAGNLADRKAANTIKWLDLGLGIVAALVVVAARSTEAGGMVVLVLPLIVAALATFVWFLVLVFRVGREPALAR